MSGHEILLQIAGGVALLLWGIRMVRTGILRAYGAELRRGLAWSTRSRLLSFAVGCGLAGLLQSSAATALLTVSFAARGLIATAPALALMLGADLGSTLVVQLLAFDLTWISPLLLVIGVAAFVSSSHPMRRHLARVAIGLGLMLLALSLIVAASASMRGSESLQEVIAALAADPLLAVIVAAALAWLFHSSVALVLLVMGFVASAAIPLDLGFALVVGANIGSALIPLVLAARGTAGAPEIPLGNLFFRIIGGALAFLILEPAAGAMAWLGGDAARQIANFHSLFNLGLAVIFLPLVGVIAQLATKLRPTAQAFGQSARVRYLDPEAIKTPTVALAGATREALRMVDLVEVMLREAIEAFTLKNIALGEIAAQDDAVDALNEALKLYLTDVSRQELTPAERDRLDQVLIYATNLEHAGDVIEKDLLSLARKKRQEKLTFSEEGWHDLAEMHGIVLDNLQLSSNLFVSGDLRTARQLAHEKQHLRELEARAREKHLARLRSGRIESVETSALHLDVIRDLKRINSHIAAIAYTILEQKGESLPLRPEPTSGAGQA